MKLEVEFLHKEYDGVLTGYTMLLALRLANLAVKANAITLLHAAVMVKGEKKKIEEVSNVGVRNEDIMEIYPFHEDLIHAIGKAVMEIHPEFKQSIEIIKMDEQQKDYTFLRLTMPEVDDNRHDTLLKGVDAYQEATKAQFQAARVKYTARMEREMFGRKEEEQEEAAKIFDDLYEEYEKKVKKIVADKQAEIENAYQRYQDKQAEKEQSQKEQQAAQGTDVINRMKMPGVG